MSRNAANPARGHNVCSSEANKINTLRPGVSWLSRHHGRLANYVP